MKLSRLFGNVLAEDGKGKWWKGYNPHELYAQNHPLSNKSEDNYSIYGQWAWGNRAVYSL